MGGVLVSECCCDQDKGTGDAKFAVVNVDSPAGLPSTPFAGSSSGSRRVEFKVHIKRQKGEKLGLEAAQIDDVQLLVETVRDGCLKEWNLQNPESAVQPGDELIEVNGQRGTASQLVQACGSSDDMVLVFKRVVKE
mmetsp:Transcript_85782/g.161526  ORF Transcript_85782/g.161526 Transcript_85782/m.161526 type:complete len:136 (+) Transcript_85782:82-489(+)